MKSRFSSIGAFIHLAFAITAFGVGIESPVVNLDEIRWKTFKAPTSEVYIDTSIQFTPSTAGDQNADPAKDKLALWLNVEREGGRETTNLCVYASLADLEVDTTTKRRGVVIGAQRARPVTRPHIFKLRHTEPIVPGRWYRLTVRTIGDVTRRAAKTRDAARGLLGFQIYLDGTLLFADKPSFSPFYLNYAAGSEGWLNARRDANWLAFLGSGAVFASLCGESADRSIRSVGFRGDGQLDDIDVTSEAPTFIGVDVLDFTLSLTPEESAVRYAIEPR